MARPVKKWFLHLIFITAKTTTGGSAQKVAGGYPTGVKTWANGIIKQETSRGYYVQTGYGQARCRLVASNNPGYKEAFIKATDDNGNSYFVTKLTAHKATVTRWEQNGTNAWLHADGDVVQWAGHGRGFSNIGTGVYIENDD